MGWLDNSTNNIILDAVLTDYGRQALARNDGSFKIVKFALGDDEVDYTLIKKYGRTIGREKIEKNTPVFEAFTNQNIGLKYKMFSVPLPILYIPNFILSGLSNGGYVDLKSMGNSTTAQVTVEQKPTGGSNSIDPNLQESYFDVYVPDMFLSISNQAALGSPDINKIATYSLAATNNPSGNPTLTFTLAVRPISISTFDVYGVNNVINTQIRVVGKSSGYVADIPVKITKN